MTFVASSAPRNEKIGAAALLVATMAALSWGLVDHWPSFSTSANAAVEGRAISTPSTAVLNLGSRSATQPDMG
jgi:hypothetical protein